MIVAVYASGSNLQDYTESHPNSWVLSSILNFYSTNNSEEAPHFVLDYTYMINVASDVNLLNI